MGGDAEARDGHKAHEGPVADEQRGGDGDESAGAVDGVPDGKADEAGDEVADGDAGEDAEDAHVRPVEVGEGGEEDVDGEENGGAPEDVERERAGRLAAGEARREREDDGGADQEEEVGKDEVGEGEAVPGGVVELGVDVGPVAGIVDQDHEGDGEAAKGIDGEDAAAEAGGIGDPWY